MSKLMKSLLCALILPVTLASGIARISYVTRRQYTQSSLPQHHQYTLVQPWELSIAPFQVADGTIGTSTSRQSILELPLAELSCWSYWLALSIFESLASPLRARDRKFRRCPSSDHRVTKCQSLIRDFDFLFSNSRYQGPLLRTPASAHVLAARPWHTGYLLYLATPSSSLSPLDLMS
jgi:hypothetical protein